MFARTPFVSWGITALYPDVMDLFVEEVDEVKQTYFDAQTGKHEPFETIEETIKVRLGSDVTVIHKVTRNGVLIQGDMLNGSAG